MNRVRSAFLAVTVATGIAGCVSPTQPTLEPAPIEPARPDGRIDIARGPSAPFVHTGTEWLAGGPSHKLRVQDDGALAFSAVRHDPRLSATKNKGRIVSAPLTFAPSTIQRGAARGTSGTVRAGQATNRIEIDRGIAVERLIHRPTGVEQTWTFAAKPAPNTQADLVVRVPANGLELVGSSKEGLKFRDPQANVSVTYSAATWVDAGGQRTSVEPRFEGGQIVMTVPWNVVEGSAYPAVLDPTISAELPIEDGNLQRPHNIGGAVAYAPGPNTFLVLFQEFFNDIEDDYVQIVNATTGAKVGPNRKLDTDPDGNYGVDVSFDGANFQVVFVGTGSVKTIQGQRVDPTDGHLIDVGPQFIYSDADPDSLLQYPYIATNQNGRSLVAFARTSFANITHGARGLFIQNGVWDGVAPIQIQPEGAMGVQVGPGPVASSGTGFLSTIVQGTTQKIGVRTVTSGGTVGNLLNLTNDGFGDVAPAVVSNGAGKYLVSWLDGRAGGSNYRVYGAITDGTSVNVGGSDGFKIYDNGGINGGNSVAYGGGRFLAPFIIEGVNPLGGPIASQEVLVDGSFLGNTVTTGWPNNVGIGNFNAYTASVSNGGLRFLVSYYDNTDQQVRARLYDAGTPGSGCLVDGDCVAAHCIANFPAGTGKTCCASACTAASSCVIAQCSSGTCTQTNASACKTYCDLAADPAFATCSVDLSNPWKDTDGDGFSDKQEDNEFIDYNCNGAKDNATDGLFPRRTPHVFGNVDHVGSGSGQIHPTVTDSKAVIAASTIVVTIKNGGGVGTATFNYTVNGGAPFPTQTTRPAVDITGNIRLMFYGISFTLNDTYSFTTSMGPQEIVADKTKPNVWVQYDYMGFAAQGAACVNTSECVTGQPNQVCQAGHCNHDHRPGDPLFRKVIDDYNSHGMKLYIDPVHNALPHAQVVTFARPTDAGAGPTALCSGVDVLPGLTNDAISLFEIKNRDASLGFGPPFSALRKPIFRYAVLGHFNTCLTSDPFALVGNCTKCPPDRSTPSGTPSANTSGIAELPGNDFIVSLGASLANPLGSVGNNPFLEGGVFMHELGHTLGLHHAGDVPSPADAPNYLSVMNGRYVFAGIQNADMVGSTMSNETKRTISYSEHELRTLKESSLVEGDGVADPSLLGYTRIVHFTDSMLGTGSGPESGTIDWDGTGLTTVTCDVNGSGSAVDTMVGYRDYDHNSTLGGACVTTADCRVNAIRKQIHDTINPLVSDKELCVAGKCQPIIHAFQCMPWGLADAPAPPEFFVSAEPDQVAALQNHTFYPMLTVDIDVRPGCGSHWVAPSGPGTVPVVIYGSADLDVTQIVTGSLNFAGASAIATAIGDVNGDTIADLTATFEMASVQLSLSSTTATMRGWLTDSTAFQGVGAVTVVAAPGPIVAIHNDGTGYSATLGPPSNHLWVGYTLADCVDSAADHCGNVLSINLAGNITKITSDEPSSQGAMQILGNSSFQVRRERDGNGDGRVYTVHFTVTSGGDVTATSCRVQSRHDNGPGNAVDSGAKSCVGSCP